MIKSFLIVILVAVFIIQIFFSFFYSSEIITQNNLLNTNQETLQKLKIKNQELEITLSQLTSLQNLNEQIKSKNYLPIIQEINLDHQ